MTNKTISPRAALITVAILVATFGMIEWRALFALDHPAQHKTDCMSCHSDAKTLKAMADKAGGSAYLVHKGAWVTDPHSAGPNKSAWPK